MWYNHMKFHSEDMLVSEFHKTYKFFKNVKTKQKKKWKLFAIIILQICFYMLTLFFVCDDLQYTRLLGGQNLV